VNRDYFAACPKGLENLLFNELKDLGADTVRETVAGVYFSGDHSLVYKVCLWSRLANKILLPLAAAAVSDEQDLYKAVYAISWEEHLSTDCTFRVDFLGTDQTIRNSQFGAVRVKDAIVDRFQAREQQRPSVDKQQPHLIINARLSKGQVHISLDLSGQSLHRRGYRQKQGAAPLKENLACAILLRANWPEIAAKGGYLIDPMCGSGTFLIEGLMMAADIAPGLKRSANDWGFTHWHQFDTGAWATLVDDAKARKSAGLHKLHEAQFECRGYDVDWRVLRAAEDNIARAGFEEWIKVSCKPIHEFSKPSHKPMTMGLLICNPPYGERVGEEKELLPVYQQLGQVMREDFVGWQGAVITSNESLAKKMGLRAAKKYKFWNGPIPADVLLFDIQPTYFFKEVEKLSPWGTVTQLQYDDLSEGAKMVHNRLLKNQKQLRKWLATQSITCYRLYDADIPEYSAAIDIYGEAVHVQEYAAPNTIDETKAKNRFQELLDAVTVALTLDSDDLFVKQRRRNKGKEQYTPLEKNDRELIEVTENNATLLINLWSYLDSGLFLDHRPVRQLIRDLVKNKSFLNLFCYTATASVHAALAGASSSVSVDMSNTYIEWARKNYSKNTINPLRHTLVVQDCLVWLQNCRQGFDVILLDPPSFSNSKRMEGVLDIQRDHVTLIQRCMDILNPGGTLIFSNNLRSFSLDPVISDRFIVNNISDKTIDPDFQRNRKIHQCWLIRSK